jgi:hypothetical protein
VGQHQPPAGPPDEPRGVRQGERVLGHVADDEVPVEGLLPVPHDALLHQVVGDVRAAQHAVHVLLHGHQVAVGEEGQALPAELAVEVVHDLPGPPGAVGPHQLQLVVEGPVPPVVAVAEEIQGHVPALPRKGHVELHPDEVAEPGLFGEARGLALVADGVVVGDGDEADAALHRLGEDLLEGPGAVRPRPGVDVEVYLHAASRREVMDQPSGSSMAVSTTRWIAFRPGFFPVRSFRSTGSNFLRLLS